MPTRRRKVYDSDPSQSTQPLANDAKLCEVLQAVGPGEWLFIGLVSKQWALVYKALQNKHFSNLTARRLQRSMTSTLYSTVFQSNSRLLTAWVAGLGTYKSRMPAMLPLTAGQHASIDTLKYAARLGIHWPTDELCWRAAKAGDLPKLKWLLRRGADSLRYGTSHVADNACEGGNLDMLR
jgi:hypothetical protein